MHKNSCFQEHKQESLCTLDEIDEQSKTSSRITIILEFEILIPNNARKLKAVRPTNDFIRTSYNIKV